VEKITRWLPRGFRSQLSGMEAGFMDLFHELYEDIHDALLYLGANDTDCEGMGATLTLAWFTPGWMYYAHIGDSRIYYLTPGDPLKQLSHDDSYVGWLFRQGKINEREARMHPQRRLIQRALGAGHQFVVPQVGAVGLAPGDRFLLCSDGLVDGLWNHQMESVLNQPSRNGETTAETLVREAVENSGDDNVTAIVIDVARVA
jgi:protein phosphatase